MKKKLEEFKTFALKGQRAGYGRRRCGGRCVHLHRQQRGGRRAHPIISLVTPGMDFSAWHIGPIMIGNFINAVVSFLILAACVFALVKGMNALMLKKEEAPPPRRRPRPAKRKCC